MKKYKAYEFDTGKWYEFQSIRKAKKELGLGTDGMWTHHGGHIWEFHSKTDRDLWALVWPNTLEMFLAVQQEWPMPKEGDEQ
jgi:hypothetical protein